MRYQYKTLLVVVVMAYCMLMGTIWTLVFPDDPGMSSLMSFVSGLPVGVLIYQAWPRT